MNVTSKGYFTSQYLDKKKQMSPRGNQTYHTYPSNDDILEYDPYQYGEDPIFDIGNEVPDFESDFEYKPSLGFPYSPKSTPPMLPKVSYSNLVAERPKAAPESIRRREARSMPRAKLPVVRAPSNLPVVQLIHNANTAENRQEERPKITERQPSEGRTRTIEGSESRPTMMERQSSEGRIKPRRQRVDPDFLEEGITPAELNILENRYVPHRQSRRSPYTVDMAKHMDPARQHRYDHYYARQKHNYDNYYAREQQLQDLSLNQIKPKIYTPRTFKDVFVDKEETMEKYNPMEFVFDREEERPQPTHFKRAIRNIKGKMGKGEEPYDYWKSREEAQRKAAEGIFVDDVSDSDSDFDDSINGDEEVVDAEKDPQITEAQKKAAKKNTKFKKMMRRRVQKAKRELARNFVANHDHQLEVNRALREKKEAKKKGEPHEVPTVAEAIVAADDARSDNSSSMKSMRSKSSVPGLAALLATPLVVPLEVALDVLQARTNRKVGQNPKFHPLWNMVLNYLVYDVGEPAENAETENGDIEEVIQSKSVEQKPMEVVAAPNKSRLALANIKKGYTTLTTRWNEPVAGIFEGKARAPSAKMMTSDALLLPKSYVMDTEEDNPQEFTLEIDDDGGEITRELYYNPFTKQLEATPPTSYNSMSRGEYTTLGDRLRMLVQHFNPERPVQLMSNLNSAIKHIKIMQILFAPIDVIAEQFPTLQTIVIVAELVIFLWILYELSRLVDALCMMVKAICAPMIAMGRLMNRIM